MSGCQLLANRDLESWVFRIPGVFGGKSGPYSTIFLWVGFPFGGQKQGQNTPKLVLFEFLVTRAFSGGTIKLAWLHNRTVHSTQYTVHSTQYTVHSTQYTVHSTQYTVHSTQYTVHSTQYTVHSTQYTVQYTVEERGCPPEAKILLGGSSYKEENVFFVLFHSIPVHGHLTQ